MQKLKILLFMLLNAIASQAVALRCGNELIQENDSVVKLVKYCGQPVDKSQDKKLIRDAQGNKSITKVARWTYSFGSTEFLYVITIKSGKIIAIQTDGYGY